MIFLFSSFLTTPWIAATVHTTAIMELTAFALSPSSFVGSHSLTRPASVLVTPAKLNNGNKIVMVTKAPGRSKIFDAFMASMSPYSTTSFLVNSMQPETIVARTQVQLATTCMADDYIAACAKRQYVALGQSGVYNVTCTEGASSGSAEDARVAALAAAFRKRQVSTRTSFADLFEARKRAFVAVNGCSYEESLVKRFAKSAETIVFAKSEADGACVRYADPNSIEESYMMECVKRAATARATAGGLYGVMCSDGTVPGAAESARVRGLSVMFRNKQVGTGVRYQRKFNQSKNAFNQHSGGCAYEDSLFSKYPATAAAMRPNYSRY